MAEATTRGEYPYLLWLWLFAKGLDLLVKLPSGLPKGVRSFLGTSLSSILSGREAAGKTGRPAWAMGKRTDFKAEHVRESGEAAVHLGCQERNPRLFLSLT